MLAAVLLLAVLLHRPAPPLPRAVLSWMGSKTEGGLKSIAPAADGGHEVILHIDGVDRTVSIPAGAKAELILGSGQ